MAVTTENLVGAMAGVRKSFADISLLSYLRAHSNDPRYLLDMGYYELLTE